MKKILLSLSILGFLVVGVSFAQASVLGDLINQINALRSKMTASVIDSATNVSIPGTKTTDLTPRIMYWSGKVNQHVDATTGEWETDPDGTSGAGIDKLTYCKKWYGESVVSVEDYQYETISTWRAGGNTGSYTSTKMSTKCISLKSGTIITTPTVKAHIISTFTSNSAWVIGEVDDEGGSGVTDRGTVWSSTNQNPTISLPTRSSATVPTGLGKFYAQMTNLTPGTTYYVKTYATNSVGTAYNQNEPLVPFIFPGSSTMITVPTILTSSITSITQTTALGGGNVTSDGGASVTAKGIVWSTSSYPTIALNTRTVYGTGTGSFSISATSLSPNTTYYVRAYATNSAGTAYGNEVSFKTLSTTILSTPTVITLPPINISEKMIGGHANATSQGGSPIITKGLIYSSTYPEPTLANINDVNTTVYYATAGTGEYWIAKGGYDPVTNPRGDLKPNTIYYVRSFATNSQGTAYGNVWKVKTISSVPTSDSTPRVMFWEGKLNQYVDPNTQRWTPELGSAGTMTDKLKYCQLYYPKTIRTEDYKYELNDEQINWREPGNVGQYTGTKMSVKCVQSTTYEIPVVVTNDATNVGLSSAVLNGSVSSDGVFPITERGFVYANTNNDPKLGFAALNLISGSGVGTFSGNASSLASGSTYYYRAYAKYVVNSSTDTAYGLVKTFTTDKSVTATVVTNDATNITQTSATLNGNVTSLGTASVASGTSRGFVYSNTITDPGFYNGAIRVTSGYGLGVFSTNITNLTPNTTYYVRAYASNSNGFVYGAIKTFKTLTWTPVTSGVITASPNPCTIQKDQSSCITTLSWSTTNSITMSTIVNSKGTTIASGYSGAKVVSVSPSGEDYFLMHNGVNLDEVSPIATCILGTTWNGTKCVANVTPLPDLIVSDFSWTPVNPVVTTPIGILDFKSTIKNIGVASVTLPVDMHVTLYKGNNLGVGGFALGTTTYLLNPGDSKEFSFKSTQTPNLLESAGTFDLTLKVDTNGYPPILNSSEVGLVTESNETNNTLTKTITIGSTINSVNPTVSTKDATYVYSNYATLNGNIILPSGSASLISKGFIYGTDSNLLYPNTFNLDNIIGDFEKVAYNLLPNTVYYYRAFAKSSTGITYGEIKTFKTFPATNGIIPMVSVYDPINITDTTVTLKGYTTLSSGATAVTETGFILSEILPIPNVSDRYIYSLSAKGAMSSPVEGLKPDTTYYVRAYAKNSAGTAYSLYTKSFKTLVASSVPSSSNSGTSCSTGADIDSITGTPCPKPQCSDKDVNGKDVDNDSDNVANYSDPQCHFGLSLYKEYISNFNSESSNDLLSVKTLKIGSTGEEVKDLQIYLNTNLNINIVSDGIFGYNTYKAVQAWQTKNGLYPDGYFGPDCYNQMYLELFNLSRM